MKDGNPTPGDRVIESRYSYGQNLALVMAFVVLFAILAPLTFYWALTDHSDITYRGIRITGNAAVAGRWVGVGINTILLVIGLLLLRVRVARPDLEIVISREGVTMPRSRWSTHDTLVLFEEIESVSVTRHRGAVTFFNLHCAKGTFSIARQCLVQSDFDEITRLIEERTGAYVIHKPKPAAPPLEPQPMNPDRRTRLIQNIARSRASAGGDGQRDE
jgi:hypothetical protein